MRRQLYFLPVLLFCLLSALSPVTQVSADDKTEQNQVSDKISALVKLLRDGHAEEYKGARGIHMFRTSTGSTVAVAVFTIEAFGGGNNHTQFMAVFADLDSDAGKAAPRVLSLLDVAAIGGKGWRSVDPKHLRINEQPEDVAVNLQTQEYEPDDPMCCPSRKSAAVYVIAPQIGGRLKETSKSQD